MLLSSRLIDEHLQQYQYDHCHKNILNHSVDKYFFHVNNVLVDIVENDIVTFDLERGKRGMNAVNICTINNQLAV